MGIVILAWAIFATVLGLKVAYTSNSTLGFTLLMSGLGSFAIVMPTLLVYGLRSLM
jgi:hypothetical protein